MLSDAHFLAVAHIVADAGTCSRLKVGAVLVYSRRIISTGYNGAPAGMPHCDHYGVKNWGLWERLGVIQPPKSDGCAIAVHAEVNAIAFAAKNGVSTKESVLYTTDSPCWNCAKMIVNAGIKEVKYGKKYRLESGINLLEEGGVRTEELGEPELRLVSVASGNRQGVHSREPAESAFDKGWSEYSASRRRGSSGC